MKLDRASLLTLLAGMLFGAVSFTAANGWSSRSTARAKPS